MSSGVRSSWPALALLFVAMGVIVFFYIVGYEAGWRYWNVPTISPPFADLRSLTHGARTAEMGLDPMIENPADPWRRPLNYPRIWQVLYALGLRAEHSVWLAVAFVSSFFLGLVFLVRDEPASTTALVAIAALSPSSMLGIERANTDLLMFFLVALAAVFASNRRVLSALIISIGTLLKLYPLFSALAWLQAGRSGMVWRALGIAILTMLYVLFTWEDLKLIAGNTPGGTGLSYGTNVLWSSLAKSSPMAGILIGVSSYAIVVSVLIFSVVSAGRRGAQKNLQAVSLRFSFFLAGAGVYLGTFLIGNNWNYRLVFLILCIPQLSEWVRARDGLNSVLSWVVLTAIFVSMWYWIGLRSVYHPGEPDLLLFFLGQVAQWVVFSGLCIFVAEGMMASVSADRRGSKKGPE